MSNYYRMKAIEQKGHECENCGRTSEVEVHHRDKNHCNNDLDNLIVLCPDCHDTVHNGWPEEGSFLRELKVDTGIALPEPIYKEVISQAEIEDTQPGVVVGKWMRKAKQFEEVAHR